MFVCIKTGLIVYVCGKTGLCVSVCLFIMCVYVETHTLMSVCVSGY